jgi:hypothetical protein
MILDYKISHNRYGSSKYARALEEHILKIDNTHYQSIVSRRVSSLHGNFRIWLKKLKQIEDIYFRRFLIKCIIVEYKRIISESITFNRYPDIGLDLLKVIKDSLKELK